MTRSLRTSAVCPVAVLLALAMGNSLALARQARKQAPVAKPMARISMPWNNSLIRANVPVFGVANAPNFRQYRVEFGKGRKPKKWRLIKSSTRPKRYDPWAAGKVKWNPDKGADGNLATWDTGLTSYRYGRQEKNLNGVYTLRVVVEDKSGETAQARVVVTVGRAITRLTGGVVESPDGKAYLNVPGGGSASAFMLASIQAVDSVHTPPVIKLKPPTGLVRVGEVYGLRPPGVKFVQPASFRMYYAEKDLHHTDRTGKQRSLPEGKLGIYAYLPVEETWAPVAGSCVHPESNEVRAPLKEVTPYVAFYAVMGDVTPPPPPTLVTTVRATERRIIAVSGSAEPLSTVEVFVDGAARATAKTDREGTFSIRRVPLPAGGADLTARAADAAGNRSKPSTPIRVVRERHPPRAVKQAKILGKPKAEQGDRFQVELVGEDSHPAPNTAYARVTSATDPKGIELELAETGPQTGVYAATFSVGKETDPNAAVIAARKHRERITATSLVDERTQAHIEYVDTVPPLAPTITSTTHPSLCQDTFENTADPMSQWANIGGNCGAALSLERTGNNTYLKLTKQNHQGHLGATARRKGYSTATFPLIAFDYLINRDVTMDVQVLTFYRYLLELNDHGRGNRGFDPNRVKLIGRLPSIVPDGRWHHTELDLGSLLAQRQQSRRPPMVDGIEFINWDQTAYMKVVFGRTGSKGSHYCIDNFRILGYGGRTARFAWSSADENGTAGYSYALDQRASTVPPAKVMSGETSKEYGGLADGRWYFHVRAKDTSGNWGPANHHMIVVDAGRPTAAFVDAKVTPSKRRWDRPIRLKIDDGQGSGVNPFSIRLGIGRATYTIQSSSVGYDPGTRLLTFDPQRVEPHPLLPADGERVNVRLLAAADYAGHPVKELPSLLYVADSPLQVTPANPNGKNGWYVTPPQVNLRARGGDHVAYEWMVTPEEDELFRKGNSINVLTITVKGKDGKVRRYRKEFRLDTTVPSVRARREGAGEGRKIILEHGDYALARGVLRCQGYPSGEFRGPSAWDRRVSDFRLAVLPTSTRRKARSIRWRGLLRPPATDVYKVTLKTKGKQHVQLIINGEVVLDTRTPDRAAGTVCRDMMLKRAMNPVEIRWQSGSSASVPAVELHWQRGKTMGRSIPFTAFFAPRSLATVFYRWDDEREDEYQGPLPVPVGKHVLHYYAADEAGHRGRAISIAVEQPDG